MYNLVNLTQLNLSITLLNHVIQLEIFGSLEKTIYSKELKNFSSCSLVLRVSFDTSIASIISDVVIATANFM